MKIDLRDVKLTKMVDVAIGERFIRAYGGRTLTKVRVIPQWSEAVCKGGGNKTFFVKQSSYVYTEKEIANVQSSRKKQGDVIP